MGGSARAACARAANEGVHSGVVLWVYGFDAGEELSQPKGSGQRRCGTAVRRKRRWPRGGAQYGVDVWGQVEDTARELRGWPVAGFVQMKVEKKRACMRLLEVGGGCR